MKSFNFVIADPLGIHARPAGLLVKKAKEYASEIVVVKGEKEVPAHKLMAIMGLAVRQGEEISVKVEGEDEDKACEEMQAFFQENF